ncbi:hypothetical protein Tco_0917036 [Tanacetum coccineum]
MEISESSTKRAWMAFDNDNSNAPLARVTPPEDDEFDIVKITEKTTEWPGATTSMTSYIGDEERNKRSSSASFRSSRDDSISSIQPRVSRFIQGKDTDQKEVDKIRNAMKTGSSYCGRLYN